MNIFVVFQRKSFADCRVSFQKCVDSFAKPENVRQTGKKQIDKFLLINAWQESMKWLLTFTLSQSGRGNGDFTPSTFPAFFHLTENWYFQTKEIPSVLEERSRPGLSNENTHTLYFLRTWVRDYGCRTHYIFHLNCRNSRLMKKFRRILIGEMWKYWHCLTPPVLTGLHPSSRQCLQLKPSSSLKNVVAAGMQIHHKWLLCLQRVCLY